MDNLKKVRKSLTAFFFLCISDNIWDKVIFSLVVVAWFGATRLKWVSFLSDCLLGQVSVPFDLVKKHPKGQQTFALMTKDKVTGSLTTEVRASSQLTYDIMTFYYDRYSLILLMCLKFSC